jgi:hypothetical protein
MMEIHDLKCWKEHYEALVEPDPKLRKSVEIRKTTDRTFAVGDLLILREYDKEECCFTGRIALRLVTHILLPTSGFVPEKHCAMSIVPVRLEVSP